MEWLRLFFVQCSFHQCFQEKYFKSLFTSVLIKFLVFTTRMVLTRLHLSLTHLRGHKFNHNFSDCLDEIFMCGKDIDYWEKKRNKPKYLTWNSIGLKFVKKTSMPKTLSKALDMSSATVWIAVKSPGNFIWYNCQKICSW